jgi:ferredoxin
MADVEERIKEFARERGVQVVGIAGPDRFVAPKMPSLDLSYSMKGAQSLVAMALPMEPGPIHDFLSKKSPAPHNFDQFLKYQRLFRVEDALARHLRSLGHQARAVPLSADYRPLPYVFSTRPALSLRYGAIAAGIAGQGWSGNVMTKEYGAAIFLGAVVTDAELKSDPLIPAGYFIEEFCRRCRRCARVCPSGMFDAREEEYVLYHGALHARGKRRGIDRCNISCFGLHSLSADRKWTNWGLHWIDAWVEGQPRGEGKAGLVWTMLKKGLATGDSEPRFHVLKKLCCILYPEKMFLKDIPPLSGFPAEEGARYMILAELMRRMDIRGIEEYPIPMICGQCALVCGPTLEETDRRYKMLISSGLVVPGEGGKMVRVDTFEEARSLRERYPLRIPVSRMLRDAMASIALWHSNYFGPGIPSLWQGFRYRRALGKAVRKRAR